LISFGFNNLNRWGLGLARPGAPFDILGLSPAPVMIVVGIVLGQAFLAWTHKRQAARKTPPLALEVIDSPTERAAVYAMFTILDEIDSRMFQNALILEHPNWERLVIDLQAFFSRRARGVFGTPRRHGPRPNRIPRVVRAPWAQASSGGRYR
jgi:hypothetical protein